MKASEKWKAATETQLEAAEFSMPNLNFSLFVFCARENWMCAVVCRMTSLLDEENKLMFRKNFKPKAL